MNIDHTHTHTPMSGPIAIEFEYHGKAVYLRENMHSLPGRSFVSPPPVANFLVSFISLFRFLIAERGFPSSDHCHRLTLTHTLSADGLAVLYS